MLLADAALLLGTESAFGVLARAGELERTGRDVVHLEIGQPDFPTPAHVSEAAFASIRAGETGYCPSAGIPDLREAAAEELARTRALPISAGRVIVANGAKPFLFFGVLATCEPGDEVIYPDPGFPIYESAIRFAGATPVPLVLREDADFAFSADELAALLSPRTKLVIVNSPQNPTGGVLARARRSPTPPACCATVRRGSSPTRSTGGCSTRASSPRSPPSRRCSSARSSSTASRRPTR